MTAVSSAALAEQVREALMRGGAKEGYSLPAYISSLGSVFVDPLAPSEAFTAYRESAALTALDRLVAELDSERQDREEEERDAAIKDRAMTDYFADASRRAEAAEAERDEWKLEAELSKWPKEAAMEYHRMKVDLPAAEAARDRLAEALNALDLAAGYYRRELKEILAHCEDDDQSLAISKIRAHAQDAIRAADASLAAAGSGGNTEEGNE